jgi:hypothetical protein
VLQHIQPQECVALYWLGDGLHVLHDFTAAALIAVAKAFYGTNDISGAIGQAMHDSRVTYTLGYYPAGVKWDGSFHELKVKVAAPGAQVRARIGYYPFPDAPLATPRNDRALIAKLATSWLPATGIGLHVHAQTSRESGASARTAANRTSL